MALTGSLYGGRCYETLQAAYLDYGAAFQVQSTPTLLVDKLFKPLVFNGVNTGAWQFDFSSYVPATGVKTYTSSVLVPVPTFPACDPAQPFVNGIFLGGIVGAFVIIVALTAVLRRAL